MPDEKSYKGQFKEAESIYGLLKSKYIYIGFVRSMLIQMYLKIFWPIKSTHYTGEGNWNTMNQWTP